MNEPDSIIVYRPTIVEPYDETGVPLSPIQLDIACTIARIEQIATLSDGDPLREHLLDRLITCDAPRLRCHLSAKALAALAEAQS